MTTEQLLQKLPEHIHVKATLSTGQIHIDGVRLVPDGSRRIRNHSTHFAWGYAGSGCAQFALALLMLYIDGDTAQLYYHDLTYVWVAGLPQRDLDIHVPLRWVMETNFQYDSPFDAAKLVKSAQ